MYISFLLCTLLFSSVRASTLTDAEVLQKLESCDGSVSDWEKLDSLKSKYTLCSKLKIIVEEVDNTAGGFQPTDKTFRLYVQLEESTDYVESLYGDVSHPLVITSSQPILPWYDGPHPATNNVGPPNANFFGVDPMYKYDSYFTIGSTDCEVLPLHIGVNDDVFWNNVNMDSTVGSTIFVDSDDFTDAYRQQCYDENRVLIAQLTTNGDRIYGKVNVDIRHADDTLERYDGLTFDSDDILQGTPLVSI